MGARHAPTPARCDGLHRCNFLQSVACSPTSFPRSRRTARRHVKTQLLVLPKDVTYQ
ncbi:hypothetical protein NSERUTF1_1939 [Nocardia seriolae]|nr:hypothetical protein NSERUTF1_1939 [Nocardia seriolae]